MANYILALGLGLNFGSDAAVFSTGPVGVGLIELEDGSGQIGVENAFGAIQLES